MADEKKTYAAFASVINSAITDFNSIYDAIKERTGANDTDMKTDTTGIATNAYAGLIRNKLFSISGITDGGTGKHIDPVIIPYFDSYVGNPVAVNLGKDGNVSITVGVPYKGYYGAEATLTGSLAAENVALKGTISGANITKVEATEGKGAYWHVAPTDGKVLGVVDIDIGSYAPSIDHVTNGVSATASVGLYGSDGINGNVLASIPEDEVANYVSFKMKAAGKFTGNVTPVLGHTEFTAGYFEAAPTLEIAEKGYAISGDATSTEQEFFIKKGTISNVKVAGTELKFNDDGDIGTSVAPGDAGAANYYKLTAGIAGGVITGNTTAGFVPDGTGTQIGNLNAISKDFYVKKGAVENSNVNVSLVAVPGEVNVASTDSDAYTVTVKRNSTEAAETTGNYSDGYVKKGTYKVSTTVAEKVLKIARGAVKINNTLDGISYAGSGADLLVKNAPAPENRDEYYEITPTVALISAVDTGNSREGYIKPSDTTVTHNEFVGTASSLYLKKGKVTHSTDITINNSATDATAIFTTTKPTGVNYYTLTTKCNISANEGYIKAADIAKGDEKSYYLPKAVVKYVADSTGKNFVQVESAGYLPSGTIETIVGDIDYAAVSVNIGTQTGENIIKTTHVDGDYKLTIAKAAATNAGYISGADGEGTVDFAGDYYIAKGSVASQASIDSVVKSDITRATGEGASGFKFDVTASGSTGTPTITAGYITSGDVTLTKPTDKVVTMTLPEAQLAATLTGNVHAGADLSTGLLAGDNTSKYFVTPTLANATVKATVGSAGYVDTASSSNDLTINIGDDNRTVAYIKTGTTKQFTTTALDLSGKLSSNFNSTVSGDYAITLAGTDSFTGTLDTGYYGEDEKTIGVERGLTGTYTVAHGSVSVNSTAVTLGTATSSDVSLVTAPGNAADFAAITVPVSSVAISFNTVKPGYVKDSDVTNSTAATGSTTVYLKKYENSDDKAAAGSVPTASDTVNGGTTQTVYTPVPNGITDTTILHTEGRYLKHNVKVTLHADAIGEHAETDLEKLQKRLAGQLARA